MAETPDRQPNRLDPKRKSLADADTYELNLDDKSPAPAPPAKPIKGAAPGPGAGPVAPKSGRSSASSGGDTYDLAEVEEPKKPARGALRPELDPRLTGSEAGGGTAAPAPEKPAAPKTRSDAAERAALEGRAVPKLYQSEPEPETIDPAVASRKREEARVRAAQEQAEEDARRFRVKMIVLAVVLALVVVGYFGLRLMF